MNKNRKLPRKVYESPRLAALELLVQVAEEKAYSNLLLKSYIAQHRLSDKDSRLMTEIVYGTISRRMTLEYGLTDFVEDTSKIEVWVRELLLLSMYQMEYLDKVPVYSVISEAVNIAKAKGNDGIARFVNGVLRNVQRKGPRPTSEIKNRLKRLSTEISLPKWLTKKLVDEIGYEETEKLGYSLLEPSKVSARVDTHKIGREQAVEVLISEGIDARISEVSPYGIVADKGFLAGSTLFKDGILTVQDESSMLVAPSMLIEPQHKVLDACAAPGGKTVHIASFLDETAGGNVTALDIYDHKIKLIEENAERLDVSNVVTTKLLDAREVKTSFSDETFDRILVDAPCSGLGLLRRKPDIKYSKSKEDFLELQKIQLEILESVVTKVKEWGIITYSTCTMTSEENQEVIAKFLDKYPNFEKIDIVGADKLTNSYHDKMLQIYPHHYQTDGFLSAVYKEKHRGLNEGVAICRLNSRQMSDAREKSNQDTVGVFENKLGIVIGIVADGMGGHQAGDTASQLAVTGLGASWEKTALETQEEVARWLITAIQKENRDIYAAGNDNPEKFGMGTTVVLAVVLKNELLLAHVGDSRGYIIRKQAIKQLTSDHSLVNELVKTGEITKAMAKRHPKKNVLLRSVGVAGDIEVDISVTTLKENDYVLLCSDGLSNMLEDDEIKKIVLKETALEKKVELLIDGANEAGGSDNITVLLMNFDENSRGGEIG